MKKSIIILTILCSTLLSYGQLSVGISAGSNLSTMSVYLRDLSTFRIKPIFGYNASLIAEYKIKQGFSLLSGLTISQKGFNQHIKYRYSPNSDSTADMTSKLTYLEIPFYLKFSTVTEGINLFCAIGPFVSYGLQGTISTMITGREKITITDKVKWDKPKDYIKSDLVKEYGYTDIKRSDYGVGSMIGLRGRHLMLSVSYQYSLQNIMWEYYQDEKMSNSSLSLSVGYYIN